MPINQKCRSSARAVASSIWSIDADCHRFRLYGQRNPRVSLTRTRALGTLGGTACLPTPVVHRAFSREKLMSRLPIRVLPLVVVAALVALTGACGKKQPPAAPPPAPTTTPAPVASTP